jgi:hydrogenase maturation protease
LARSIILGVGNVLLADDGAGVRVTEALRERLAGRPELHLLDGGTLGFVLLEFLSGARDLLVIDAAELGAAPGEVRVFEGESMDAFLADTARRRSVHEVGLLDVLTMARLRDELPEKRALICIQAAEIRWGLELTPAVGAAVPAAANEAERLLDRWRT